MACVTADIDAGNPSPVYLVMGPQSGVGDIPGIKDALSHSHQVIAYAYSLDDASNLTSASMTATTTTTTARRSASTSPTPPTRSQSARRGSKADSPTRTRFAGSFEATTAAATRRDGMSTSRRSELSPHHHLLHRHRSVRRWPRSSPRYRSSCTELPDRKRSRSSSKSPTSRPRCASWAAHAKRQATTARPTRATLGSSPSQVTSSA